ncbi:Acetyltransferase (GNAT) family protein [Geopseudomonas sagittaria]|uniref:Acetyltransferase (GNAT) family protein n=1 Tax=Geopseudomonas sagittaria TaxID=1135990 RepID=A0A1I5W1G2_9GAMM|nr:GNAT family N-acetyltransferase [Pseudomonas sagittaria]SFQ13575.1 Acetyltransferase (GNAT) family protein [Pseudomonas sagittaria]
MHETRDIHCELLAPLLQPLLGKFYRAHRSPMRAPSGAQTWVARRQEILAALNLTPLDHGHWLTGLLVAPTARSQGLASQLIEHALARTAGPVWLFCHPDLVGFYRRLGFEPATQLPPALAERLARYQRSKALLALARGSGAHGEA